MSRWRCAASPATPIIWGGYFPTLTPMPLNAPYVDYAIRGPGEETFGELCTAISCGRSGKLESIAGLTWKRAGSIVHNADRAFAAARLGRDAALRSAGEPARTWPGPSSASARRFTRRHSAAVSAAPSAAWRRCSAAHRAAARAQRLERDLTLSARRTGRRSDPVLRSQFLRPRRGHDAAAGGAGRCKCPGGATRAPMPC